MKAIIEDLLPRIINGEATDNEIQAASTRLKQFIRDHPDSGKELGALMGKISQAVKARELSTGLNWVAVSNGFLAIGHKPGGKVSFEALKKEGATGILTLLQDNEGAASIGSQASKAGLEWIWFPFSASRPHEGAAIEEVKAMFAALATRLQQGGKLYIHCSAGIHRTGMISYALLRFLGQEKVEAGATLQQLREVTAVQAGEDRLAWGDQFMSFGNDAGFAG